MVKTELTEKELEEVNRLSKKQIAYVLHLHAVERGKKGARIAREKELERAVELARKRGIKLQ